MNLFKNVREIRGVIQIWNTQLTSISFIRNIRNVTGDPLEKTISILNNTKLVSLNISSLKKSNGNIEIRNNGKLNLQKMCSVIHDVFFNRRFISGNLFDCGCDINEPFKWPMIKNFPSNCIVLYGNLIFEGNAPPFEVLYRLSTVNSLFGFIQVKNTNLETLGFLQNLQDIESGIDASYTIYMRDNIFLRRLDLIRLQSIKNKNPDSDVYFDQNNADLCLDPSFVQLLGKSNIRYIQTYRSIKYCELDKINNPSTYCTGKLSTINDRCTRYLGNILYFNDQWSDYSPIENYTKISQVDMKKIQQLEVVFGSIFIQGTLLTNFTLPSLQEIYQIDDVKTLNGVYEGGLAIGFRRNDFLEDVSFPSLRIAFQSIKFRMNENLTMDGNFCAKISNGLKRTLVGLNADYDCRYMITTDSS